MDALQLVERDFVRVPPIGAPWTGGRSYVSARRIAAVITRLGLHLVLLHDLLRASTSSQGYHKMTGAIRAEEALHDLEGDPIFSAGCYYTSVFGSPDEARWAWMLTGHHMAEGPGRQASLTSFQGIRADKLDEAQQRLLWLLVQEFVGNADYDAAEAQLALVQQTWADTHFAWQGPPPTPKERFYFRVHGPRILIEYDVQEPLTSSGGHIHAVTRDPTNDYGTDW